MKREKRKRKRKRKKNPINIHLVDLLILNM